MTDFFSRLRSLPNASPLDSSFVREYETMMEEEVIPMVVRIEEEQRLLAAEARLLPIGRAIFRDE